MQTTSDSVGICDKLVTAIKNRSNRAKYLYCFGSRFYLAHILIVSLKNKYDIIREKYVVIRYLFNMYKGNTFKLTASSTKRRDTPKHGISVDLYVNFYTHHKNIS